MPVAPLPAPAPQIVIPDDRRHLPSRWARSGTWPEIHIGLPSSSGEQNVLVITGGGTLEVDAYILQYGAIAVEVQAPDEAENTPIDVITERVSRLKGTFNLSLSDLATVLHVERPTIYAWLRGDQTPRERNQQRIEVLARIADELRHDLPVPLKRNAVRTAVENTTLLELLSSDEVDFSAVREHIGKLRREVSPRYGTFGTMAARRGESIERPEDAQDRIDVLTGKPTR